MSKKDTCSHGPAFGQAVGDILTYPKKFDPKLVQRVTENIKNNSTLFPTTEKKDQNQKNK